MENKEMKLRGFINEILKEKNCTIRRVLDMNLFNFDEHGNTTGYSLTLDTEDVVDVTLVTPSLNKKIKEFLITEGEISPNTKVFIKVEDCSPEKSIKSILPRTSLMGGKDYLFSVDAETDGLFGNAFSIGVMVYDRYGNEFDSFYAVVKDADKVVTNEWVKENVLPKLDTNNALIVDNYEDLIKEFSEFYLKYKDNSTTIWHMGQIVEVFLFREAVRLGYLGMFDTPYLPIEMSNLLMYYGLTGDSVDNVRVYEGPVGNISLIVKKSDNSKSTHNALYDAQVTAELFFKITK